MGECGFSHARHQSLPIEDAKRLSRELSELLAGVDIIGLRAFGPNPSDVHIRKISQAIDKRNLRGALGMIEALQYAHRAVKNGEFHNTVLTSAWVHLGLLEHLDVLLDNAPRKFFLSIAWEIFRICTSDGLAPNARKPIISALASNSDNSRDKRLASSIGSV